MDHTILQAQHKTQLRGDVLNILGDEIYYRLYYVRRGGCRRYIINITSGKESASCSFGRDKTEAVCAYEEIVKNTVTPCTLRDIAEDFAKK